MDNSSKAHVLFGSTPEAGHWAAQLGLRTLLKGTTKAPRTTRIQSCVYTKWWTSSHPCLWTAEPFKTSLLSPIKRLSLLPMNPFACEMFFQPVFEHSTAFPVCCRSCPSLFVSFTKVSVCLLSCPVPFIFLTQCPQIFFGLGGKLLSLWYWSMSANRGDVFLSVT